MLIFKFVWDACDGRSIDLRCDRGAVGLPRWDGNSMMALMSPRLWLALGLAAVLVLSHAFIYRTGKASVRADWDAEKLQLQQVAALQEAENRKLEAKRQTNVIEAKNAQAKRTQVLQASAAGARSELDRLRDAVASIPASLPSNPGDAIGHPASAAPGLLADCSRAYQELAAKADGHLSDTLTLQQAWPK